MKEKAVMILLYSTSFVAVIILLLYLHFKYKYLYWKKKNLSYFHPHIPFGNVQNSYNRTLSIGEQLRDLYKQFRQQGVPHGGIYLMSNPVYMPVDPEFIKHILTKDFSHFVDRGHYVNTKHDPLSGHLVALGGERWKSLRSKLTPTFTSGKLRQMYATLLECSRALIDIMDGEIDTGRPIDIKEVTGRFTTDIIGCCAFGLEFNAIKDDDSPFRMHGKKIFQKSKMRLLRGTLALNFPNLARIFGIRLIPKDTADFFINIVEETVEFREKNNFRRDDFMQLLIDLKNKENENGGIPLSVEDIAAQCFVFFLAGFETSSTTMSFVLYELTLNQDIQDRVRREIEEIVEKHGGELSYAALMDMKYLSQVIDETMRKYPAVPFLSRRCVKDYKVPDTDLVIENGTRCLIPVMGLHYDEEYYPNPDVFDPDRFSEENKRGRHQYAFLPFGDGPRNCIGSRFGLLETKVGLAVLLKNYQFTMSPLTQYPIQFSPNSMMITPKHGVWLDAIKISRP